MPPPPVKEGILLLILEWTLPLLQDSEALKSLTLVSHAVSDIVQPHLLHSLHQLKHYNPDVDEFESNSMISAFVSELHSAWRPASFVHAISFSLETFPGLEELHIEQGVRDISSIISQLPNLQNISIEICAPLPLYIDLTAIFSDLLKVQRRASLEIAVEGPVSIAPVPLDLLRDAACGLRSLSVSLAEELGTPDIQALLDGASSTLQSLSIPFSFFSSVSLDTLRFPRLESFTYLDDGEYLDIVPFLDTHAALTTLAISGRFHLALAACPNVTSLTLDAELSPKQIEMDVFSLPSRGALRELHLSLIESASELDLQDVFSSLYALEDLTISGWFSNRDCGMSYANVPRHSIINELFQSVTIKAYTQPRQIFPSMRRLEVYYSPLRLVSIPAYPSITLYEGTLQPDGWHDIVSANAQAQEEHVTRWATLAIPHLVRGIAALAHQVPLERVRWVPCHYHAYSDDVDIIVRRDEGRLHVQGGFRRTRLHEEGIPKWKWDKLSSSNTYTGPWNVATEVVETLGPRPN